MAPAEPRVPLTLDELLAHLIQFRALHPAQGQRPVHLLDMAGDDGDGLITAVDLPPTALFARSHYLKVRDRASYEFALASAAVAVDVEGGTIR